MNWGCRTQTIDGYKGRQQNSDKYNDERAAEHN